MLLHEPALLLLDEPANALDADGLELLQAVLEDRQRAVAVATHDPRSVEHLATGRLAFT